MTPLERSLERIAASLRDLGHRFAVVGGLAVSVRAEPRLTRDVDLAVAVVDDASAERMVRELATLGYRAGVLVEQDEAGRLATVRLTHRDDGPLVCDLLFASCGIETEIVESADPVRVTADLTLPVASTGHLIAMKLLARDDRRRPADADDLAALRSVAADDDWAVATTAVAAIEQRGFARGRDLSSALIELRMTGSY